VFNTPAERNAIAAAVSKAAIRGRQPTVSPYGDGESSQRFADAIAAVPDFRELLKKGFYDMAPGETVP
jgi:UDP-N-acetylglucosamine 2-epimerase (non-hydrolysing)/GDP/UDP-N,N'-diacetylbacillosamine 2-epimerase (hydrolysing)